MNIISLSSVDYENVTFRIFLLILPLLILSLPVSQNGKMDEITRLFKSFHGYSPPQCSSETWLHVTTEEGPSLQGGPLGKASEPAGEFSPGPQRPVPPEEQLTLRGSSPYCQVPSPAPAPGAPPAETPAWVWPWNAEPPPVPNSSYAAAPGPATALDFYACVNGVNTCGAVQLVPCVPANVRGTLLAQGTDGAEKGKGGPGAGPGAGPGGCYTTMDELQQHRAGGVDAAPAQGGGQRERLSRAEQSQIPAPSLSAVTEGFAP